MDEHFGRWLLKTSRRLVSMMNLGTDPDADDLASSAMLKMMKAFERLDHSKPQAQLWCFVRNAGIWGIQAELHRRARFWEKRERYLEMKEQLSW